MKALLALLLAAAATPAAAEFRIGDLLLEPADILDARAAPEPDGRIGILVTFTPEAGKRLAATTAAAVGRTLPIAVDGRVLMEPRVEEPVSGSMTISTTLTIGEAAAVAKRISGKEPLPEEFDE